MDQMFEELASMLDALSHFPQNRLSEEESELYMQNVVTDHITKIIEEAIGDRHLLPTSIDKVVHYTSIPKFLSMIEERRMRLYDSDHTNDPKEGIYFESGIDMTGDLDWRLSDDIMPAYIACFVISRPNERDYDNLVYWRTYGHDGAGCSIEFFAEGCGLNQVLYGSEELTATYGILETLFEQLKPVVEPYSAPGLLVNKAIKDALSTIRYLYKSEPYEYEKECRKIVPRREVNLDDIRFHYPTDNTYPPRVRHYCYSDDLVLKEILNKTGTTLTLGPAVYSAETTKRSIRTALDSLGIMGVDVRCSKIDYQTP